MPTATPTGFRTGPAWRPVRAAMLQTPLLANRQAPDPDPGLLDDYNGPTGKGFLQSRKVCQQQGGLRPGPPLRDSPEQDHRGFSLLAEGQERSEVSIGRQEDPRFRSGAKKDGFVGGTL